MKRQPTVAYARLNARIMPLDRGEMFEDPLSAEFEKNGFGEVTGGGTMQERDGEIDYCGLDLDLYELERSVPFVCEFLTKLGAPKGSALEFERDGERTEVPFGAFEGVAIYLNGTDLPDEVYANSDINVVYADIDRLLAERGEIRGHWRGPRETALYLYGPSSDEMTSLIAAYLAATPLCQRSRLVKIA